MPVLPPPTTAQPTLSLPTAAHQPQPQPTQHRPATAHRRPSPACTPKASSTRRQSRSASSTELLHWPAFSTGLLHRLTSYTGPLHSLASSTGSSARQHTGSGATQPPPPMSLDQLDQPHPPTHLPPALVASSSTGSGTAQPPPPVRLHTTGLLHRPASTPPGHPPPPVHFVIFLFKSTALE
jgi:hypothetical protein